MMWTPRYLNEGTVVSWVLLVEYGDGDVLWKDTPVGSHLFVWRIMFHKLHHSETTHKSAWTSAASDSLVTSQYITQSSAKKLIEDDTHIGESLI